MLRDPEDETRSPLMDALSSCVGDALRDRPPDSSTPRDSFLWRWTKFLSCIVVPAVLLGVGFAFEDYVVQTQGQTWLRRQRAEERVKRDTWTSMRARFFLGASIGGALGTLYVARCL